LDSADLDTRLSRIATKWSMVMAAHGPPADAATAARQQLMLRYHGAVYRYLLAAVRDPEAAEDLSQEFAVRCLRGDFHRAAPERGRFRDYLKTALINLANDHHRSRQAGPERLAADPAAPAELSDSDAEKSFVSSWREELLERTWKALAEDQPTYHAALQLKIVNPEMTSAQIAEELTRQLGKPMTAVNVRKALQRAHDRFADLLLDEIACSLGSSAPAAMRVELTELDLLKYCRQALERRETA
jgi:RNA polymerase sigma-70 factor (ECF subfamily)